MNLLEPQLTTCTIIGVHLTSNRGPSFSMPMSRYEIWQPKISKNTLSIVIASFSLAGKSHCHCYFFNGGQKLITDAIFFLGFSVVSNKNPTRESRGRKSEFCGVFLIASRATPCCRRKKYVIFQDNESLPWIVENAFSPLPSRFLDCQR
ncbi:hypothetical protein ACLOJK_033902 [Asimina triloba]